MTIQRKVIPLSRARKPRGADLSPRFHSVHQGRGRRSARRSHYPRCRDVSRPRAEVQAGGVLEVVRSSKDGNERNDRVFVVPDRSALRGRPAGHLAPARASDRGAGEVLRGNRCAGYEEAEVSGLARPRQGRQGDKEGCRLGEPRPPRFGQLGSTGARLRIRSIIAVAPPLPCIRDATTRAHTLREHSTRSITECRAPYAGPNAARTYRTAGHARPRPHDGGGVRRRLCRSSLHAYPADFSSSA